MEIILLCLYGKVTVIVIFLINIPILDMEEG